MTTLEELRLATPDHVQRAPPVGRRAPAVAAAYARHLADVRAHYESTRDFALVTKLGFAAAAGATGRVGACAAAAAAPPRWAAQRNAFPYELAPGLEHYVLWSNDPRAPELAATRVYDAFPAVPRARMHWFVNEGALRTFDDVWHAHVFIDLN